jgi:hypothetical protein
MGKLPDPTEKIFAFNLGPNLQSIGISKWIFNANNNEYILSFNNNDNDPIKVQRDEAKNAMKDLQNIRDSIATTLNKPISSPTIKAVGQELKQIFQSALYGELGKYLAPKDVVEKSSLNKGTKGKGRGRKKDTREKVPSPIEEQEQKDKQLYQAEVLELKRKFEAEGFSYKGWQQLVKQEYFKLRKITEKNIPDSWEILELCLTMKCILHIRDNTLPLNCILLGPPSSNKTTILEMFRKHYRTYYTDQLGPHSFVSHNTSYSEEELQKIDVIPKMKDNLVLVAELAPIFTLKEEDMIAVIGVWNRISDGRGFAGNTGAHGKRGYPDTMYSFLGAAAKIPYPVWRAIVNIGFKLYFFRLDVSATTVDDLKKGLYVEKFVSRKDRVEEALRNYLKIFDAAPACPEITRLYPDDGISNVQINWELPGPQEQQDAYGYICEVAYLLSHLRTQVSIYTNKKRKTDEDTTEDSIDFTVDKPQIENPTRARDLLVNVAAAHAISQGRDTFDNRDVAIAIKLGLSTTTEERSKLIWELINSGGTLTTTDVCNRLNWSTPTAIKHIREFKTTGIVTLSEGSSHKKLSITLRPEFKWFLSDVFKSILRTETVQNETEMANGGQNEELQSTLKVSGVDSHVINS